MIATTVSSASDDQKHVVANLIQLYLYDMTQSMPFPVGADGRYEYEFFDRFWRFPYLIHAGGDLVGFAFVIDECALTGRKPCWFMAEFFVLKAYRRRGVGQAAVAEILIRHPGDWHVAVPLANAPAQGFWRRTLAPNESATRDLNFEGDEWRLHAFRVG